MVREGRGGCACEPAPRGARMPRQYDPVLARHPFSAMRGFSPPRTSRETPVNHLMLAFDPWRVPSDPEWAVAIALFGVWYGLAARHFRIPWLRIAAFYAGLALIAVALLSPIEHVALDSMLSFHLLQNVMLADWAPPLLVLGLTPAMAAVAERRAGRAGAHARRPSRCPTGWPSGTSSTSRPSTATPSTTAGRSASSTCCSSPQGSSSGGRCSSRAACGRGQARLPGRRVLRRRAGRAPDRALPPTPSTPSTTPRRICSGCPRSTTSSWAGS